VPVVGNLGIGVGFGSFWRILDEAYVRERIGILIVVVVVCAANM
jgi:hypothetical protein